MPLTTHSGFAHPRNGSNGFCGKAAVIIADDILDCSASLGAKQPGGKQYALYEPIHGSAPDIAGKGIANPLATILSVAMMLKYSFAMADAAEMLEKAVENVLDKGIRTADIMQEGKKKVQTSQMGDAVVEELTTLLKEKKKAA